MTSAKENAGQGQILEPTYYIGKTLLDEAPVVDSNENVRPLLHAHNISAISCNMYDMGGSPARPATLTCARCWVGPCTGPSRYVLPIYKWTSERLTVASPKARN